MKTVTPHNWIPEIYTPNLVTVIIPTYNREIYLQQAVQSIIDQTYRPIECIVIDDGSSDNTIGIINKLIEKNDGHFSLKYIHQQNEGAQVARNTGTAASAGEFIQYLDSDDLLFPDKIENQVNFLLQNKACDGVFGDWRKGMQHKNEYIRSYASKDLITQFLVQHFVVNFSFLMRRGIIQQIGEWDVSIKRNQEIDFQVRGLLAGGNFQYQKQECGLWRIHQSERIATTTGLKEVMYFFQKWENILTEKQLFSSKIREGISQTLFWFSTRYIQHPEINRIIALKKAIQLNPDIPFFNSIKIKWLNKILGTDISVRCWLFWFKLHRKRE